MLKIYGTKFGRKLLVKYKERKGWYKENIKMDCEILAQKKL
jgi:hypothetical protein